MSRVPVEVRLLRVQPVTGRGTLKWLFDVQIDIQGVEIEVRDSKAEKPRRGFHPCAAIPWWRWAMAACADITRRLMAAIGDAFIEEIGRPELAGKGRLAD